MQTVYKNLCYRCGKERTVLKVWKEYENGSTITNSESVCPDPACQKIVAKEITRQRNRRKQLEQKHLLMARKRKVKIKV